MMELKSKKNILVLGATWTIWNMVFSFLSDNIHYSVFGTVKNNINYKNPKILEFNVNLNNDITILENIIIENNIDIVINCIWIIRPNENDIEHLKNTFYVNSYLPKYLDFISKKNNFKFIQISTDCVFDWKKWSYSTIDIPNEKNIYWLSKFLWEINNNENLTIRTSIIWLELNWNKKNLLNWFIDYSKNNDNVKWFSKAFWNWITTLTLAKIIDKIILDELNIHWLIQISSNEILSKYDLLNIFKKVYNISINIEKDELFTSDKTIIPSNEQLFFNDLIKSFIDQVYELVYYYKMNNYEKNIF